MLKKLLVILLISIPLFSVSQSLTTNLVKNPSFEQMSLCPFNHDEIIKSFNWDAANTDLMYIWPEYFHQCDGFVAGVPYNSFGFQYPDSMQFSWAAAVVESYAGIIAYGDTTLNSRTHLTGDFLNDTAAYVHSGVKYYFSIRVAIADSSRYATGLGLKLSVDDVDKFINPALTDNLFTVAYMQPIVDTTWVMWSDSFITNQDFRGFSVGNFLNDTFSVKMLVDTCAILSIEAGDSITSYCSKNISYYYLDNVCISDRKGVCGMVTTITVGSEKEIVIDPLVVYPNPVRQGSNLNISDTSLNIYEVTLYGIADNLVKYRCHNCTSIPIDNIDPGMYILMVTSDSHRYNSIVVITD